jgi:hypothetical protein
MQHDRLSHRHVSQDLSVEELTVERTAMETGIPPALLWHWLGRSGELQRRQHVPPVPRPRREQEGARP